MSNPLRPTGYDNEALFAQRVYDNDFGQSQKLRSSRTVKISKAHNGIFVKVKQNPAAQVQAAPTPVSVTRLTFIKSFGDYTVCFDPTKGTRLGGPFIPVAKPQDLRNSIVNKTIYGNSWTYGYPHNPVGGGPSADVLAYIYRTATLQSVSQREGVVPQWLPVNSINVSNGIGAASEVLAITVSNGTGVALDPKDDLVPKLTAITFEEIGPRAWTVFADQSFGT